MNEQVSGVIESQPSQNIVSAGTEVNSSSAPEKTLRQSEVNELIKGAKLDAYEKGKREALAESEKNRQSANVSAQPSSLGGIQQSSPEEIERLIESVVNKKLPEFQSQRDQAAQITRVANEFASKIQSPNEQYEDYQQVISDLNLPKLASASPAIIHFANEMDNTADVMYDLGKNPRKIVDLMQLSAINPDLARREIQKLSQSIKDNQTAKSQDPPKEPLNQLKPSTAGTDSGKLTIRDYKKMYRV